MTSRPTPEQILKSIEDSEIDEKLDAELERALAMTPEERRAELEEAGVDVAELHAQADALHSQMKTAALQSRVEERKKELVARARVQSLRPPGSRRRLVFLAAAAVAVVGVGGGILAYVGGGHGPEPSPSAPPSTAPPPPSSLPVALQEAATYRRQGLAACAAFLWGRCLDDLDHARELDPEGDLDPAVQQARRAAESVLAPDADRPDKPPRPPR